MLKIAPPRLPRRVKIEDLYAGMAELADAHGSGPCESNFMQVQVLLPAPKTARFYRAVLLYIYKKWFKNSEISPIFLGRRTTCVLRALAIPYKTAV